MESVLCEQYRITNIRQLGHGNNIDRLWRSAQNSRKHSSREQNVHYEAALCGKLGRATCFQEGNVGILGSQTREAAEACLTLCPLLEDMAAWSQWGLVFQPQFGPLRVFIEKYGGHRVIHLKGTLD
ncbi:tudor domain-containing protein [Elysia marginata]|uniref:Tudor domain-containing protein n=1 Tax=Elysia marginata TaxID=1093978 RepID=A0AAV4FQM8_9GAST|nr:tudor domain-containing protein [Elysia marginata]